MINFDAVDFSEEVISFFWRSVYIITNYAKIWQVPVTG